MDPNDKTLWCSLNLLWVLCLMYMCGGGCCIMRSITGKKKSSWSRMKTLQSLPRSLPISHFFSIFFHPHFLHHPAHGREQLTVIYYHFLGGPPTSPEESKAWNKHHHSLQLAVPFCLSGICVKWRLHIRWCVRERGERKGQRKMRKKLDAGETSCEAP